MRSGIPVSLMVVALCTYSAAAERPEPFSWGDILIVSAGDPNGVVSPAGEDPNETWDPAEHLVADWESASVSMTSRLYNPDRQPAMVSKGPQWSMSVGGIVGIVDSNGLIGLAQSPSSILALDQDGRVVSRSMTGNSGFYRRPISMSMPARCSSAIPVSLISLNLPLDPNTALPEMLARVEWTMNVLVAEEVQTVDIPFTASDEWVELAPGMEARVEQATMEQGKYQYRIHIQYDATKVAYLLNGSISLWSSGVSSKAVVLKMDVLDAEGKPICGWGDKASYTSPGSFAGADGRTTGTVHGSGACDTCGMPAIIRHTLGFDIRQKEARLALEKIPVPEF